MNVLLDHAGRLRERWLSPRMRQRTSWLQRLPALADRYRRWCLLGAFLLLVISFNGQWRIGPDSAIYSTIGRHLAEGKGFTHPTGGEWLANPGLPYLIAGTFKVFGVDVMWPAVTVMLLLAEGTLALTYLWMRMHVRRGVAVIVTVLLAINSTFYRHSLDVLTDIPFMFGVMVLLVGYELTERTDRRRIIGWSMMAAGMGLMATFRFVFVVVAAALALTLLVNAIRRRQWGGLAASVLLLAIPFLIRALDPRSTDSAGLVPKEAQVVGALVHKLPSVLHFALTVHLPLLSSDATPNAMLGNQIDGQGFVLDSLITIVTFTAGLVLIRRRLLWGLIVLFFLIQWLLFGFVPRYFLPILPILIYGWWRSACWVALVVMPNRMGYRLASLLMLLYVCMNLVRTVGFVIEQRSIPFIAHYRRGEFEGLMELGHALRKLTPQDAWIVTPEKWLAIMTFASDRRVGSGESWSLPPEQDAGKVYVVEPSDDPTRAKINELGWEVSEPISSVPRRTVGTPLTTYRVRTITGTKRGNQD